MPPAAARVEKDEDVDIFVSALPEELGQSGCGIPFFALFLKMIVT